MKKAPPTPWTEKEKALASELLKRNTDDRGRLNQKSLVIDPLLRKLNRRPGTVLAWIRQNKAKLIARRPQPIPPESIWKSLAIETTSNGPTQERQVNRPAASTHSLNYCPHCGENLLQFIALMQQS